MVGDEINRKGLKTKGSTIVHRRSGGGADGWKRKDNMEIRNHRIRLLRIGQSIYGDGVEGCALV